MTDAAKSPATGTESAHREDDALSPLDAALIRRLLATAHQHLDEGDGQGWVSCFCPDGQLALIDEHATEPRVITGRVKLAEYAESEVPPDEVGTTRRWVNIPLISGEPGGASVRTLQMCYKPRASGGCDPIRSSILDCTLRKVGSDWLFSRFQLTSEHFDHAEWTRKALAGMSGSGTAVPPVEIWPTVESEGPTPDQTLRDRESIHRVLATWVYSLGFGDSKRLASLVTEDGVLRIVGLEQMYREASWHARPSEPVYRGPSEIEEFNRTSFEGREPWERHWEQPALIQIDGDTATGSLQSVTILAGVGSAAQPMTTGSYRERFRKCDGRWLIEECTIYAERAPDDLDEVVANAAGQYVCGLA